MSLLKIESFEKTVQMRLDETISVLQAVKSLSPQIENAASIILESFKNNGKLLICGNGGSAADAQHIAAEFVGKSYKINRPALPAIALHTNSSILTAIGNDFSYNEIFVRQIQAFGCSGDVLLGISTSGNSQNVLEAIKVASSKKMHIISLTGESGGKMAEVSDLTIKIPSNNTPIIQNAHITVCHIICELVESCF